MDTPPFLEAPFEEESLLERIVGLREMFPKQLREVVGAAVDKTTSLVKSTYSTTRVVTWFVCSTAAILVLPVSLEVERFQYEERLRNQEKNIIFGGDSHQNI